MPQQSHAGRLSSVNCRQRLFNFVQHCLPQHLLSKLMYAATRWRWRPWKNVQIKWFIRQFGVNMQEAVYPAVDDYDSFNDFFTRPLKSGVRPVAADENGLVSPVDGIVSQAGEIREDSIVQAKGHGYTVEALFAGDTDLARQFTAGSFATLYLSPRDYHRVHMPCAGRLQRMIHVPGRRFAVNQTSVTGINNLFARNERLINLFDTDVGAMALIMVGAIFVGSMQTVWTDTLAAISSGEPHDHDYSNARISLGRGEEMGRFNMGSTVILIFPQGSIQWTPNLLPEERVCMGERIGAMLRQRT